MGCENSCCNKTSTLQDIFILTPSINEWLTKVKVAPSPYEVKNDPSGK